MASNYNNNKTKKNFFQMEFDFWTKNDVTTAKKWARSEECRIPNKRVAWGGRLHK